MTFSTLYFDFEVARKVQSPIRMGDYQILVIIAVGNDRGTALSTVYNLDFILYSLLYTDKIKYDIETIAF
jgi:hypothetical protein